MQFNPLAIRSISLLEPAIIGNVLALRHATVNVQADVFELVRGILIDDALSALPERLDRGVIPPLLQVAVLVELPTLVVESVRDFVTNYHADAAVLCQQTRKVITC